jgi:CSLREA domain-containing protein
LRLWFNLVASALLVATFVVALSPKPVGAATTITVNETVETATFNPPGPVSDSVITNVSNNNGKCSLREAIAAVNTGTAVDGCPAGGAGDTIMLPAGMYVAEDNFFVDKPVHFVGANAGKAGYDPSRGPESTIQLRFNPFWLAQTGLFFLNGTGLAGTSTGAGSTFDGLVLEGTPESTCAGLGQPNGQIPCESTAVVEPSQGADTSAPGYQIRNSIVKGFSFGMYLGGRGGIVERNLFLNNDKFAGAGATAAVGVDIYSDGVFPTANTTIQDNRFDQPAVAAIDFEGDETGQVIQRNVVQMVETQAGAGGMLLFGTRNLTVFDNVLINATSPPVGRRGIRISNSQNIHISGNTIVDNQYGIEVRNFVPNFPVATGIMIENNRIYGNLHGLEVNPAEAFAPGAIVANPGNWWGANGGPGSTGARPGAPNPVNDIELKNADGTVVPNTGQVVINQWLHLTCTVANPKPVVGQTTSVTGAVLGMPTVNKPLFTSIAQPIMDATVTGGVGTVSGFGAVPSNGVLGGQTLAGATLTGTFTATTAGSGAVNIALDSEQVPCSIDPVSPITPITVPVTG